MQFVQFKLLIYQVQCDSRENGNELLADAIFVYIASGIPSLWSALDGIEKYRIRLDCCLMQRQFCVFGLTFCWTHCPGIRKLTWSLRISTPTDKYEEKRTAVYEQIDGGDI